MAYSGASLRTFPSRTPAAIAAYARAVLRREVSEYRQAPTPTAATVAAYPDACQAVVLGARGEWSAASLHWDSASIAASTAGAISTGRTFGAVFAMDALKISEDTRLRRVPTSRRIAPTLLVTRRLCRAADRRAGVVAPQLVSRS